MRRLTKREQLQESVKALDAFTKVDPDLNIEEKSSGGGLTTLVATALIIGLVFSEVSYYRTVDIEYDYSVDTDLTHRELVLHVDVTVATACEHLGADYVDVTQRLTESQRHLELEPAHFELSPNQEEWFEQWHADKERESEQGLDSLNRFLHGTMREPMPPAAPEIGTRPDACRVHGDMPISKVAANFHITPGKSIETRRGHTHLASRVPEGALNLSHRVDRFSFSDEAVGAHALEGDLKISSTGRHMYQYFLTIVPSTAHRIGAERPYRSNQYSVRELERPLQPGTGIPGIYFRYDFAPVGVHVKESNRSVAGFLVRLCGIIGGIVSTSGMLHRLIQQARTSYNRVTAVAPVR